MAKAHVCLVLLTLIAGTATTAAAQTESPQTESPPTTPPPATPPPTTSAPTMSRRPYASLFGGAASDPKKHTTLDLSASVAEAYDDNVLADTGGGGYSPTSLLQESGFYSAVNGSLAYNWHGRRAQFAANGAADVRYYQTQGEFVALNRSVGAGYSLALNDRTQFSINQSFSFMPAQFYALLPDVNANLLGDVPSAGSNLSVDNEDAYAADSSAELSVGLSRRSSVVFLGNYRYSRYPTQSFTRRLRSYGVGGSYRYNVSRYATLHLGYIHREGQYQELGDPRPTVSHDIDVGVDYHRPLSFSRRTRLDFGTGSAIVTRPLTEGGQDQLQYRFLANATLTHDFGRTWSARFVYNRGVGFADGFGQPIYSDGFNSVVEGFLNRRVDVHITAGVSYGDVNNVSTQNSAFRTYLTSTRFRTAINRTFAGYAEYVFYYYEVANLVALPQGLPPTLHRNSLRIGITMWVPLLRR